MKIGWRRIWVCFFLILSTVGCDQVTKEMAQATLPLSGPREFLGGLLTLQYSENTGAFLSLGAHLHPSARFWVFTIGTAAFLLLSLIYLFRGRINLPAALGLSLLVGGGIGNLIDRATAGFVVDFINIGLGPVRTGIFNFADVAIMAGVALMYFNQKVRRTIW